MRLSPIVLALAVLLVTQISSAEKFIERDGAAPGFMVEVEPHVLLVPYAPPHGDADGGLGAGVLFGINVAPRGFIPGVNDSVSIGIGVDWVQYFGGGVVAGECAEWVGTGDEAICIRIEGGGGAGAYFYVPAVMQWNFYFNEQWSAFGEPGFAAYLWHSSFDSTLRFNLTPVFNLGGRWKFSKQANLVFRVGYPTMTVGLSFYL